MDTIAYLFTDRKIIRMDVSLKLIILIITTLLQLTSTLTVSGSSRAAEVIKLSSLLDTVQMESSCLIVVFLASVNDDNELNIDTHDFQDPFPVILWIHDEIEKDGEIGSLNKLSVIFPTNPCRTVLDLGSNSTLTDRLAQINLKSTVLYQNVQHPSSHLDYNFNYVVQLRINNANPSYSLYCGTTTAIVHSSMSSLPSPSNIPSTCFAALRGSRSHIYYSVDESIHPSWLIPPITSTHCESATFLSSRAGRCTKSRIMFHLISVRLNLTFTPASQLQVPFSYDDIDSTHPALVMCANICNLNIDTHMEGATRGILLEEEFHYVMYCTASHVYQEPHWLVIFSVFDLPSRISLLLVCIVLGVLLRKVEITFDTMFLLLGQSSQTKWNPSEIFPFVCLFLAVLNQYYQADVTTHVIAPPKMKQIETVSATFKAGFKFILPDYDTVQIAVELIRDRYEKLGIVMSLDQVDVGKSEVNINDGIRSRWFGALARNKWVISITRKQHGQLVRSGAFHQNRILDVSCFVVRNYNGDDDQHLFVRKIMCTCTSVIM